MASFFKKPTVLVFIAAVPASYLLKNYILETNAYQNMRKAARDKGMKK
jgi:hypothetical protein